ncbi:hypothetical protein PACTADRAFT_5108 [Pachysolen tannophilus NRRL Y-2460]|uniref:Mitochondrial carrier protein LEU5 n=1 Tax=Pachysolen tannophilus NRRL Y-2460 TaxID=669874 RepID=A0A1E4TNK4_PACTA|nr:hypothetical protein PACTADRAFT_5108 [Pachysolen tannophilus NRRL Y-2460]
MASGGKNQDNVIIDERLTGPLQGNGNENMSSNFFKNLDENPYIVSENNIKSSDNSGGLVIKRKERAVVIDDGTPIAFEDKRIDKQSLEYVVRSGVAGGIAGCAAKTLIAPLDRVKILFQTSNPDFKEFSGSFKGLYRAMKKIYKTDGIIGLYQGHSATLLRIFPYAAIKFVVYEQIRTILIPNDNYETGGRRLLAGSLAGIASVFCTYPLDLVRVRLAFQTDRYKTSSSNHLFQLIKTIYNENPKWTTIDNVNLKNENMITRFLINRERKGLSNWKIFQAFNNFYRGFAPTILGMIPYAGVSFYTHDLIHDIFRSEYLAAYTVKQMDRYQRLRKKRKSLLRHDNDNDDQNNDDDNDHEKSSHDHRIPLKSWAQLIAGGVAGMFSQTAAYPFEVIRRRMQVGGVVNSGQFYGMGKTCSIIFKERGFKGFYVGLSIGFIKVVPMFACSFYVYERAKSYLGI